MSVTTLKTEDVNASFEGQAVVPHARARTRASLPPDSLRERASKSLIGTSRAVAIVPPVILGGLILMAWFLTVLSGRINSLFLPAPADVWSALTAGLGSGLFLSNALVTVQESILGFLLALAIALPVGYGMAKSRLIATAFHPYLAAGQAIPAIVIAPFLVLWIPNGTLSIVILCMLVVLFPMVITTMLGVSTLDRSLIDAARVEGASGWALMAHIEFPLALPALLAAVRTGLTLSITGALVGEFVLSGDTGLGSLLQIARSQFNTPLMFATLVVLAVLATVYYGSTWLLSRLADAIYG